MRQRETSLGRDSMLGIHQFGKTRGKGGSYFQHKGCIFMVAVHFDV